MSTLHLKCSLGAQTRINDLIAATRADDRAVGRTSEVRKPIIARFDEAQSSLEQFIARLEQRVSQK